MSPIDKYLANVEPDKRAALERIREIAKRVRPDAEETIGYNMPTLKYDGKPFLGFAARANHIGLYPYSGRVIEELRDKLAAYETSKGAIRVPLDAPIPERTLRAIVTSRLREIRAAKKA